MTTGKTIALTRRTFVDKVMSLLFNMLGRLVITFLPRSKRLLISWLQSPSTVILEPKKYIPSFLNLPSTSTPCHPSRLSQSPGFTSLNHMTNHHWLSILCMVVYMFPWYSLCPSQPRRLFDLHQDVRDQSRMRGLLNKGGICGHWVPHQGLLC